MERDKMGNARKSEPSALVRQFLVSLLGPEYLAMEQYFRSFVYVIQAGEDGPVKIGSAREPSWRLNQLQCGSWQELHLRAVVPCQCSMAMELDAHALANSRRIRGEWFDLTPEEAVEYIVTALTLDGQDPLPLKVQVKKRREERAKPFHVGANRHKSPEYIAKLKTRLGME
jgi:Meiotically up-regulated gene 113